MWRQQSAIDTRDKGMITAVGGITSIVTARRLADVGNKS